ncbi:hypothetical protein [Anditalea andensis]|nr:hypothetical protein [Anditalea andensis]
MKGSKLIISLKIFLFIALIMGYSALGLSFDFQLFKWVTLVAIMCYFLFISWKFYKHFALIYANYMFNQKSNDFNKHIDKPRILIYSIFWPLMIIAMILFIIHTPKYELWIEMIIISPLIVLFSIASYTCHFTWQPVFSEKFIPQIKKRIQSKKATFKCHYSVVQLRKIFKGMIEYELMEYEDHYLQKQHINLFTEIFQKEKLPDIPPFDLKMINSDIIYFFRKMETKINGMTNPKWAQIFTRNGAEINPSSLYIEKKTMEETKGRSEKMDMIDIIFSQIGLDFRQKH